jgi:CTP synthase (UTP-ammonia lyase)
VWIAPGSPYQSLDGALAAIRFARERNVPLLGTCGGFQHVVLEWARNVLGIEDAAHEEYLPGTSEHPHPNPLPVGEGARPRLFISRLACSLVGQTMQVRLVPGTLAAAAYGSLEAEEQYYCNFGINPEVVSAFFGPGTPQREFPIGLGASPSHNASTAAPAAADSTASSRTLMISGVDQAGEPRVIELAGHSFFVATLYVPQMQSRPGRPHPLVSAWLNAAGRTVW